MKRTVRRALYTAPFAAAVLAAALSPAFAVVTSTWTVETFQQFDQGDATSAFITSLGELRPGWDSKRVALEGDGVWSTLRLGDGSLLVGTDADGAIYKVAGDSAKKVATLPGAIAAVALAGDGTTVYAGAMPSNQIWKIDVASGKAAAIAKLEGAETVWALALAPDGTLWAGTGPDGALWSINAKSGAAKKVFETEDKRVTALAVAKDGAVWLGTSERALVFRHDKSGTRAMADFAGNEVSALATLGDGVVVAANDLAEATSTGPKSAPAVAAAEKPNKPDGQPAKLPDVGTTPGADKETPSAANIARKGERKGKGAIFRVGGDGRLEQLHALTQTYFTDVLVGDDGSIYGAAADKGRIYLIAADDSVATAFDVDERAVSHLFWDGKNLGFTTDDAAAVYRVTGKASQAKYVSEVFDAKTPSKFGRLQWQASGKLAVETRSGNTAKPGVGWSSWAAPGAIAHAGGGADSGKIASPTGRYLQFRISFDAPDASLRRVMAWYVPQNQATELQEVTVELANKESNVTLKDSAARPRSPLLKVKWKTENPDGDDTTYTLSVRRDGEAVWRPVVTGKAPLTATTFEWNTETFPDGWYRLRVTASDAVANSPDRTLTTTKTTPLFVVDNQRPTVDGLTVDAKKGVASARAADTLSVLTEMAFSVDDGPWQLGTTSDGIFDDISESMRIDLPRDLAAGTHTVAVRVADAAGNVGSTSTTFVTK